jgi:hypothetical protein
MSSKRKADSDDDDELVGPMPPAALHQFNENVLNVDNVAVGSIKENKVNRESDDDEDIGPSLPLVSGADKPLLATNKKHRKTRGISIHL